MVWALILRTILKIKPFWDELSNSVPDFIMPCWTIGLPNYFCETKAFLRRTIISCLRFDNALTFEHSITFNHILSIGEETVCQINPRHSLYLVCIKALSEYITISVPSSLLKTFFQQDLIWLHIIEKGERVCCLVVYLRSGTMCDVDHIMMICMSDKTCCYSDAPKGHISRCLDPYARKS